MMNPTEQPADAQALILTLSTSDPIQVLCFYSIVLPLSTQFGLFPTG